MEQAEFWQLILARLRKFIGQTWDVDLIADMTGATPGTVGGWLTNDRPAVGEKLIKLWHLLAAAGIESPELNQLPSYNRYLGELLTFGIIDMSEATEILNVKNVQTVLGVLRGTPPMHPNYTELELKNSYDQQLLAAKLRLKPLQQPVTESSVPDVPTQAVAADEGQSYLSEGKLILQVPRHKQAAVDTLATLLGAASPLARLVDSDEYSPADRSKLRMLLGESGMFDLSNTLHRLCSERALAKR